MTDDPREFWGERWSAGRIGFHQPQVHPTLTGDDGSFLGGGPHRVLVPLCGKSWDVPWLADQGHEVVGVEIVRQAIEELFAEHDREATVEVVDGVEVHHAGRMAVWCADFFALPPSVGRFDRVWDRAAIVAVPPARRADYAHRLKELAPGALLYLTSIDYDQDVMEGPPHALSDAEVERLFADAAPRRLRSVDLAADPETRWAQRGLERFDVTLWSISLPA